MDVIIVVFKMRILLIQPKYVFQGIIPLTVTMPLGLCYLAAMVRQRGHEVKILDCLAEGYKHQEKRGGNVVYGLSDDEILKRIESFSPQLIGCSALFSCQSDMTDELCRLIKQHYEHIPIVTGGMHATVHPHELLASPAINFVLRGEADYTFADLVDALENHKDYSQIDGIGYKTVGGQVIVREKNFFIQDLDSIPFPARDLLSVDIYYNAGLAHGLVLKSKKNINLITSRGCPASCIFCTIHQLWGRKFRARTARNVLAELEQIKNQYGAEHIQFEDDNLTFDIERAKEIFRGMVEKKFNFSWNTPNGVALWRMDEEALRLMKKAGCYSVTFAVESGSQRVLTEVIKKPQRLDRVVPLIGYARKIGLNVGSFFVVGFPGETKAEIQETFQFPYKTKLDWAQFNIASPHFGTELRRIVQENGWLSEHTNSQLGTGLINTPDFDAQWLTNKIMKEYRRYLFYLLTHRPWVFWKIGTSIIRNNSLFVFHMLLKIFRGRRS